MKFEYFPDEIITALAKIGKIENSDLIENAIGGLYDLKAICENKYNSDYYRDTYKFLEIVTKKIMEG